MKISKTKISNRAKKKTNSGLVETIIIAKKHNPEIARALAYPRRKAVKKNLGELDFKESVLIVPGKVLGGGEIEGKKKIIAVAFSESAKAKIKKSGSEALNLAHELKKGKKLEGKLIGK